MSSHSSPAGARYGPFVLVSYPCPLCGEAKSRHVMTKRGVAVPIDFEIVACASCGHVRVDPRIPDERLDELYDAAYYRGAGFDRTVDYEASPSATTKAANDAIVATVVDAAGGSLRGLRWLDVGCGTGGLLEEARRRGAVVFGTDSSPFAAASCAKKGLVLSSDAEIAAQKGAFDIVTAIEVIEHVPDPRGLLSFLRSCVRAGGIVYVGTGNWNLVRHEPGSPYLMPEGHIGYFTPAVLRRLFRELSLREVDVVNQSWIVARSLSRVGIGGGVRASALLRLARLTRRWAPAIAPFPVGVR